MKINYRNNVWKVYDFFALLRVAAIDEYEELFIEDIGVKPDKRVVSIIKKLRKYIDFEDEDVKFFTNKETGMIFNFIPHFYLKDMKEDVSIDEVLEIYEKMPEDEIRFMSLLLYFMNDPDTHGPRNDEYLRECLSDVKSTLEFIKKLDISDENRWKLYEFIENPKVKLERFIKSIHNFKEKYKQEIVKYQGLMDEFSEHIQNRINTEGDQIFREELDELMSPEYYKDIEIRTSFILFDGFRVDSDKDNAAISVGFDYQRIKEHIKGKSRIEEILNVISMVSDGMKFKILNCMKGKEVYGKEICEKTGLSKAALSYHINQMFNLGVIGMRRNGKKVYYSIKKSKIEEAIESLKDSIL